MSDGRNDKTLSNERLPDPRSAAEELAEGSPRQRTADHLKRILVTGMVLPIAAAAASCRGYFVVDPPPPPYIKPQPGALALKSTPVADIEIDGKPTGLKTPQTNIELAPGMHTIKLTSAEPRLEQTFIVEIMSGKTISEDRDLRSPAPR